MQKAKHRYTVAESHSLKWVEDRVDDLMEDGWEPHGSPVIFFTGVHGHTTGDPIYYYAQAMVLRGKGRE